MIRELDCLGLGIAPIDLLMEIECYPKPGSKIDATGLTIQGGGPIPTAMVTLARLGMRAGLIMAVGDDPYGRFVTNELRKEGVETISIVKKKRSTAAASGWVEKGSGRRTIVLDLNIEVKPGDIELKGLPKVRAVHLDGRYLPSCIKLARWAKKKGAQVVFDIGSMRNDVTEILPMVDHLVCAEDFALPFTGTKKPGIAIERLKKVCDGAIVVTSGINGSLGLSEESGFVFQRAFKIKTVDTTGAGDVFHGAYIFGLLKGWNLKRRLEFASAAAAIKCTRPGGRIGIPRLSQVQAFLKRGVSRHA